MLSALLSQLQKRHDLYSVISSIFRPSPDTVVSQTLTPPPWAQWYCSLSLSVVHIPAVSAGYGRNRVCTGSTQNRSKDAQRLRRLGNVCVCHPLHNKLEPCVCCQWKHIVYFNSFASKSLFTVFNSGKNNFSLNSVVFVLLSVHWSVCINTEQVLPSSSACGSVWSPQLVVNGGGSTRSC